VSAQIAAVLSDLAYVVLALFVLLVAKVALGLMSPFKLDDQLSAKDNPAFGVSLIGYYLAVVVVYLGAVHGDADSLEGASFAANLAYDGAWALGGVVLLNLARILLDRVVLRRFSTRKEIVEDRNAGVGAVELGTYLASALVVAGAISGTGGGVHTALAFFGLGQVALIVFALIYQAITRYDFHDELEKDNVAAGVAYAGNLVAMGVLLMRGSGGDFVSWSENLTTFGYYAAAALVLLVVGHFAIDALFLPGRTLHEEIAEDKNVNAGYLEGGLLVALSVVVFWVV